MRHAIIVYGPTASGKTTWIKNSGFKHCEQASSLDLEAIDTLPEGSVLCVEAETDALSRIIADEMEARNWSVSFRKCGN